MKTKRTEKACRHSAIKGSGIHKGEWTIYCKACGRDIAARYWKRASRKGKWLGLLLCVASACGATSPDATPTNGLTLYEVKIVHELDTNWTSAGQSKTLLWWSGEGQDPNVTTYHERGTVTSNTFAVVNFNGKTGRIKMDTAYLGTAHRSYTIETRRVYGTPVFRAERYEWPITNGLTLTNCGDVFTNSTNFGMSVTNPPIQFPSR